MNFFEVLEESPKGQIKTGQLLTCMSDSPDLNRYDFSHLVGTTPEVED